jgi:hypothetical protein
MHSVGDEDVRVAVIQDNPGRFVQGCSLCLVIQGEATRIVPDQRVGLRRQAIERPVAEAAVVIAGARLTLQAGEVLWIRVVGTPGNEGELIVSSAQEVIICPPPRADLAARSRPHTLSITAAAPVPMRSDRRRRR